MSFTAMMARAISSFTNAVIRENLPTHWIALLFAAQIDPETASLGDPIKMLQLGWFKPDEFPKPRHSMLMRHFNKVKEVLGTHKYL